MPSPSSSTRRLSVSSGEESTPSPQLSNPRTQDVFQSIVNGRKSWKTLRGGEVVWPPDLEAALIEGLENYQPDNSRETRLLGRFPLRNRYISNWILKKTGKRRTAKQVGSRLQQLRDTCGGRKLINLISPRRPLPPRASSSLSPEIPQRASPNGGPPPSLRHESESGSDRSSPGSPTTPKEIHTVLQNLLYRGIAPSQQTPPHSIIYIDLLPTPTSRSLASAPLASCSNEDELMWAERGLNVVRISPQPRHITEIDPTVTFTSRSPASGVSVFSLYANDDLIYSEKSPLKALGFLPGNEQYLLYSTPLLPGYWAKLIQMTDLSQFTILHQVVDEEAPSSSHSSSVLFSTMYKFKYSPSSFPLSSVDYSLDTVDVHKDPAIGFAFDSMLSMPPSPEQYHSISMYDRPQSFYELASYMKPEWQTQGSSVAPYQSSH